MDILLHDDNNIFMFIKSKCLITRNLIPKQQQQQQQQQPPPKKNSTQPTHFGRVGKEPIF